MAHYGFLFDLDENWIGGSYYFRNLLSALKLVPVEAQPDISMIGSHARSFRFLRETGYEKLHWIRREQFDAEPDAFPFDALFPWPIDDQSYRTVSWIPDLQEYHLPELFSSEDLRHRRESHEISFRGAGLIVSSEDVKLDVEHFYKGVHPEIAVVHFAAFNQYDLTNLVATRKKYHLDKAYVMCPNQVWIHKNHIVVLKAISILKDRGLQIEIVFTGNESDYRAKGYINVLKRLCNEWGIEGHVRFLGFIPREEQLLLMRGAEYILQPSLFEGWSTVIEDAKWMGQYVLASDLDVNIEQLTQNGTFFPVSNPVALADSMEKLHLSPPKISPVDYEQSQQEFGRDFIDAVARFTKNVREDRSAGWMPQERFAEIAKGNLALFSEISKQTVEPSQAASEPALLAWQQHAAEDRGKTSSRQISRYDRLAFARGYRGKNGKRVILIDPKYYRMQNSEFKGGKFGALVHYLRYGHLLHKTPHPLFDEGYYIRKYPDVAASPLSPIIHFLRYGIDEGRDPHPLFDSSFYLDFHKDVAAAKIPAFIHFLSSGSKEKRASHPLFDQSMYLMRHPDVREAGIPALTHYLYHGLREGRAPHPFFDVGFYTSKYSEVLVSGMNPYLHFLEFGISANRTPNPFFDPEYYAEHNADVSMGEMPPMRHYLTIGQFQHRSPGPNFDPLLYLAANTDVEKSGMLPLSHYLWWGRQEGRAIYPAGSTDWQTKFGNAEQFYLEAKRKI